MGEAAGLGGGVEDPELVPIQRSNLLPLPKGSGRIPLFGREPGLRFAVLGEEADGFQRGHAALAGRGDRLPVDVVGDVAGGERPRRRTSPST